MEFHTPCAMGGFGKSENSHAGADLGILVRKEVTRLFVLPNEGDQAALDTNAVRAENTGLIGWVCRFERDRVAFFTKALQCRFFIINQGDNNIAGIGAICPF